MDQLDANRTRATNQAKQLLGLNELTTLALFRLADATLGASRAGRCVELSKLAPLTRRWVATSAVAELIVGTRSLGIDWWTRDHQDISNPRYPLNRGTPDALLLTGERGGGETCLDSLGNWIADDAADAKWGRPIDYVDLNDPQTDDRFELPPNSQPGDRLVLAFDPGGRVWADVVRRDEVQESAGRRPSFRRTDLGSVLTRHEYVDVAETGWAWGVATNVGPIYLPGESPGAKNDPFADLVDVSVAERLHRWAAEHDPEAGTPMRWRTKGDLWLGYFGLGLPYLRTGEWFYLERALRAAVDGDEGTLMDSLRRLPR